MKLFILSFVVLFLSLSTVQAREEGISVREANSRISTPSTPAPSSVPVPTPAPRSDIPIPTPRPDNTDDEDILNSS